MALPQGIRKPKKEKKAVAFADGVKTVETSAAEKKQAKTRKRQREGEQRANAKGVVQADDVIRASAKKKAAKKAAARKVVEPRRVLLLRFLPKEFQEKEIYKFLSQLGKVNSVLLLRHKKTASSKGVAYVRFEDENIVDAAVEEIHGQVLGDNVVKAKPYIFKRSFPSHNNAKMKMLQRKDWNRRTKGPRLVQKTLRMGPKDADASDGNYLQRLKKSATAEKKNNAMLKDVGIEYEFCGFRNQLERMPEERPAKKRS